MWGGRVSIIGLYNLNKHIFDDLILPEGMEKDKLIQMIWAEAADLEAVYTEPYIMQQLIGAWSNSQQYEWDTLFKTQSFEYNPIDNYDRTETETEGINTKTQSNGSLSAQTTTSYVDEQQVTGFNTDAFSPNTKQLGNGTDNTGTTSQNSGTGTVDRSRTLRSRGNIGVTTTQKMIREEREIAPFNMYTTIVNEFVDRFCVHVY